MSTENPQQIETTLPTRESVIGILKSKGSNDNEAITLLARFTDQIEWLLLSKGRKDARIESLRVKAHILREANCFNEAIDVMEGVAKIAYQEGDDSSLHEAIEIIDILESLRTDK